MHGKLCLVWNKQLHNRETHRMPLRHGRGGRSEVSRRQIRHLHRRSRRRAAITQGNGELITSQMQMDENYVSGSPKGLMEHVRNLAKTIALTVVSTAWEIIETRTAPSTGRRSQVEARARQRPRNDLQRKSRKSLRTHRPQGSSSSSNFMLDTQVSRKLSEPSAKIVPRSWNLWTITMDGTS